MCQSKCGMLVVCTLSSTLCYLMDCALLLHICKVFGRFRPLNSREKKLGANEVIHYIYIYMLTLRYVFTKFDLVQLECEIDDGRIEMRFKSQKYKCILDGIYEGSITQVCLLRLWKPCMCAHLHALPVHMHAYGLQAEMYEQACRPSLLNLFNGTSCWMRKNFDQINHGHACQIDRNICQFYRAQNPLLHLRQHHTMATPAVVNTHHRTHTH